MNKQELVDRVSAGTEMSKSQVNKVLDAALQAIKDGVANGEMVQLMGFGSFAPTEDASANKVVKFTAGKSFKDAVNAA